MLSQCDYGYRREIAAPGSTRQPSLWNAEFVPDLITGPCDAGIQVGDSSPRWRSMTSRTKSDQVASWGSSLTSRRASSLIGVVFDIGSVPVGILSRAFRPPFAWTFAASKLGNKLGTISAEHHQKSTRMVQ